MEGNSIPNLVDKIIHRGINFTAINFNIKEVEDGFKWDCVTMPYVDFEYGKIVDAIVTFKYPNDKMQAVINNYLLEPENPEYITAFNEMQAWRKEAKEIAKQALEYELH